MSSLSFVSSSIVYYLVFKVQLISFETLQLLPRVTRRCFWLRSPFGAQLLLPAPSVSQEIFGGLKWTRTTDLTLIRRAL